MIQLENRRFYEIPCLDKLNWADIGGYTEDDGIDYYSLWKSIDEECESPIVPYLNEIKKYQENFRSKTLVEDWLSSEDLVPGSNDKVSLISAKKLHLEFMNWLKIQNCNFMYTLPKFGKEMTKHLENKKRNDGSYYIIKVKTPPKEISPLLTNEKDGLSRDSHKSISDSVDEFIASAMEMQVDINRIRNN